MCASLCQSLLHVDDGRYICALYVTCDLISRQSWGTACTSTVHCFEVADLAKKLPSRWPVHRRPKAAVENLRDGRVVPRDWQSLPLLQQDLAQLGR